MNTKTVYIEGKTYEFARYSKRTSSEKYKRALGLACKFDDLDEKFTRMVERGGYITDHARMALACRLMMHTGIRVGNESSAEGYITTPHPKSKDKPQFVQTYGLTTMLRNHVDKTGNKIRFMFLGKRYVDNYFEVGGSLAKQIREFMKVYEGDTFLDITAYELTKFIKKYVGRTFTPKDFRTLRAHIVAYDALEEIEEREYPHTKSEFNAEVKEVAVKVSEALNNTPGVCKKSYIDSVFFMNMEEIRPITKRKED